MPARLHPAAARAPAPCPADGRAVLARGFTLVEMLVVTAILVVVLGLMAPSMSTFLAGQRARGLAYDLVADLMLARNEALKRNVNVAVTRGGTNWNQGWRVSTVATDESLSLRNAVAATLTVSGAPAAITFDPNGRVAAPLTAVRITISASAAASSRCIELDPSGRARTLAGACT